MKRRLTKLVVFLLLGAVVNVAVAWGLCIFSHFEPVLRLGPHQQPTKVDLNWMVALGWTPLSDSEQWVYTRYAVDSEQTGSSISWIFETADNNPRYDQFRQSTSSFVPMWVYAATGDGKTCRRMMS